MQTQIMEVLRPMLGLMAGTFIGVSFGMIQKAAWRRNQRLEQAGKFNSGWAVMPGSMRRVAYLLVALALVQMFCPLLFTDGSQWWVSGGVVAGYGSMLFRQIRQRTSLSH